MRLIDFPTHLAAERRAFAQHRHRRAPQGLGDLLLPHHVEAKIGIGGRRDHDAMRIDDADAGQRHLAHVGQHRRQHLGHGERDRIGRPSRRHRIGRARQDRRIGEIELRQQRSPALRRGRRRRHAPVELRRRHGGQRLRRGAVEPGRAIGGGQHGSLGQQLRLGLADQRAFVEPQEADAAHRQQQHREIGGKQQRAHARQAATRPLGSRPLRSLQAGSRRHGPSRSDRRPPTGTWRGCGGRGCRWCDR